MKGTTAHFVLDSFKDDSGSYNYKFVRDDNEQGDTDRMVLRAFERISADVYMGFEKSQYYILLNLSFYLFIFF